MTKRAAKKGRKQAGTEPQPLGVAMQMMMLPLLSAYEGAKQGLMAFVQQMGLLALSELFAYEAATLAGPKGRHDPDRTLHHWGSAQTRLPFGGRTVSIERPRVRQKGKGGKEVELPSVESMRAADPMSARVAEPIVLGVSTRSYGRSLEPVAPEFGPRGTSKSNARRALIDRTTEKLAEFINRKLDDLDLVAMFIDGIEVAHHSVIVALGVTIDGTKVPLGVWTGSTENSTVATALLQNLVERGLRAEQSILFVIDGGKGIRKALRDVFGNRAIVQRCQVHKMRNVTEYLPEERRALVARQMRDAYKSTSVATAKKKLQQLISWLEKNGEDSAASSLREGLDETLTTLRLGLSKLLCRTFSTTNAIENMNGTLRRVNRNVKRWQGEAMIRRWVTLGNAEAQRGFRRVKGYANMAALITALRPHAEEVESNRNVA